MSGQDLTAASLATRSVAGAGASPTRWLAMLHGLLGRGRNWASIANAVVAVRPEWGVLLVDLRLHGDSRHADPPHDVAHAAEDVRALFRSRGIEAVLGHSFGGKVALALAADPPEGLAQAWIVDASPSKNAPEGDSARVLAILRSLPPTFATRDDAVAVLQQRGVDEKVARWVATNLRADERGLAVPWNLDAIAELLADYFAQDLWNAIESRRVDDVFVLKASRDSALSEEDLARLRRLAARDSHLHVDELEGGHWLHVDARDEVVARLVRGLPRA